MATPGKKRLLILGSTGSIGTQCLDVVRAMPGSFEIVGMTAGANVERFSDQVREFDVPALALGDEGGAERFRRDHPDLGPRLRAVGEEELTAFVAATDCDLVVNGLVGVVGLLPTLTALGNGTDVALANKESLVVGGELLLSAAARTGAKILPVDSEHSALFQLMATDRAESITRVIITASGGPFRTWSKESMAHVGPDEVTNHPTWSMGHKISVDSATLMNKGLEVIEAHHLFNLELERIKVLIHPQSIVHGLVEYGDGTVLAHMSETDMRIPLAFALSYPDRVDAGRPPLDLAALGSIEFEEVDNDKFPCLDLCYTAAARGGTAPAVLNAANEVAVETLLRGELPYLELPRLLEQILISHPVVSEPGIEDLLKADGWARRRVLDTLGRRSKSAGSTAAES